MAKYPIVLTIAGSDSSGGAGIQADIKTMSAIGVYAASAVTAVTAQNTLGVDGVQGIDPDMVARQIDAVFSDLRPDAVKIGMLYSRGIAPAREAARCIVEKGCRAALVKGGHLDGDVAVDVLFADGELREYSSRRVVSVNTHGTGCTLSSAVASFLALGFPLAEAVGCAKNYLHSALVAGANVAVGGGHGPVNHLFNPNKLKTI